MFDHRLTCILAAGHPSLSIYPLFSLPRHFTRGCCFMSYSSTCYPWNLMLRSNTWRFVCGHCYASSLGLPLTRWSCRSSTVHLRSQQAFCPRYSWSSRNSCPVSTSQFGQSRHLSLVPRPHLTSPSVSDLLVHAGSTPGSRLPTRLSTV